MAYWRAIRGVGDPIPIRSFNGLYVPNDDGINLPDGIFTELVNFSSDSYPALSIRQGYNELLASGQRILGIGSWKNTDLHVIVADGTWRRYSVGIWTTIKTGLSTTAEATFCNFKGNYPEINLIMTNGVDAVQRYDGSTVSVITQAPAGANFMTTHSNRLYCMVGNSLRYSALSKPNDWTSVGNAGAGSIEIDTLDGETVTAINAGVGYLTVFKPSSIFELYGKGPNSYALETITTDVGCVSNKAITVYNETLFFLSRDGVYGYSGGLRPTRDFATPVYEIINGIDTSSNYCCIGHDGRSLYISLPKIGGGHRIIQYDVVNGSFYTWEDIKTTQLERIDNKLYAATEQGQVIEMLQGHKDNHNNIKAHATLKPFTAYSVSEKQQWFKLWIVASVIFGKLEIYLSPTVKGENWVLAKTYEAREGQGVQFQELLVPLNSIANSNIVRLKIVAEGNVVIHEITRQLRILPFRR